MAVTAIFSPKLVKPLYEQVGAISRNAYTLINKNDEDAPYHVSLGCDRAYGKIPGYLSEVQDVFDSLNYEYTFYDGEGLPVYEIASLSGRDVLALAKLLPAGCLLSVNPLVHGPSNSEQ